MKKLIIFLFAALLTVSVTGQNAKNHSGFLNKESKQKHLLVPGMSDKFLNFEFQPKSSKQYLQLKEANAVKQRLDSVVFAGSEKDIYVYDANGNILSDNYFDWDGTKWVNSWKDEYAYDGNGNQIQNISYEWNGSQWVNSWKNEFSYDANGNKVKEIQLNWDGSNWINSDKDEYSFDSNGNQTEYIGYTWEGNQWFNSIKAEYTFDSNGTLTKYINYNREGDNWLNNYKMEFVFDANGKNTETFAYSWDGENWYNSEKYEASFDANENITEYVYSDWNSVEWVEAAKYKYEYDDNGNMTLSTLVYIDGDESFTYLKEESVYDDFDNRISYSYYEIDFENENFPLIPVRKEEYVYDNNFSFDDLILPFSPNDFESDIDFEFGDESIPDINQMFKHKLTHLTYYDGVGDSWVKSEDYIIYYSEQNITSAKDLYLANNVNVYPNPATNQVTFELDASVNQFTVEFYDIQGKLVLTLLSNNNQPVSIESLNEGLFFYRMSDKLNFYTGKFMVK